MKEFRVVTTVMIDQEWIVEAQDQEGAERKVARLQKVGEAELIEAKSDAFCRARDKNHISGPWTRYLGFETLSVKGPLDPEREHFSRGEEDEHDAE